MKRYLFLQLKRAAKIFPFALSVSVVLLIGLITVLYGILSVFEGRDENKRFTIALTGDTDNEYMQWGIAAMQTFDETRFSVDFAEMSEEKAAEALKKGEISAYVVMPENFVEKAISGDIEPITYVTSAGMENVATLFKKEITTLVTDMVVYSQKGAYGLGEALADNGLNKKVNKHINQISLEYTELIFNRDRLYSVKELGISNGLSTPEYYICAIAVILLSFMGLPFTSIYIKKDHEFNRLMLARGFSLKLQLGCEYCVQLVTMLLQIALMLGIAALFVKLFPNPSSFGMFNVPELIALLLPIAVMFSAFDLMMFELSGNIVSGLMLHFFAALSLCFISGCMYPIYAFPNVIEKLAAFLPTGIARELLSVGFGGTFKPLAFCGLFVYALIFYMIALLIRYHKTVSVRR